MKLQIQSTRLLIRNLEDKDLEDFLAYRSQSEVTRYQGFDPYDRKGAMEFITSQKEKKFGVLGEWLQLAIIEKTRNKLIGDCAVKLVDGESRIAEIGFTISPEFQKYGYGKETMLAIMKFLFDEKQVHRVVEITDSENISSIKLIESIGFRREGHFVENAWFKGKWCSEFQYAMLKREWDELNPEYKTQNTT